MSIAPIKPNVFTSSYNTAEKTQPLTNITLLDSEQ